MSTGTRAFRAATARQVKQELVRVLFGHQYARTGPDGHRMLDYSIYSYADLKKAYLRRLQEIHPDKMKSNPNGMGDTHKRVFQELQNAWDKYDEMARAMKKVSNDVEANFTMFGVGCSFSDNEEERALRSEITDQACRGWFCSGALAETTTSKNSVGSMNMKPVSLVDDEMFEEVREKPCTSPRVESSAQKQPRRRTLIPGLKI